MFMFLLQNQKNYLTVVIFCMNIVWNSPAYFNATHLYIETKKKCYDDFCSDAWSNK